MAVRAATILDAHGIGRVQVETWRSAYRGLVPDAYLARLSVPERAAEWRARLDALDGGRFALSAHDQNDELIGFAAAGPERSGHPVYRREVYAIYVLPSHQRRGVGRALMQAVAARLAAERSAAMLLWVLEANAPARRFYATLGGTVLGEQPIEVGGAILREVAYGWLDVGALLAGAGPGR